MYIGHLCSIHMRIGEKAVVTLNQGDGKCVLVLAHGLAYVHTYLSVHVLQ